MDLLWIVVVILVIAWALGFGGVYHLGGNENLIHILLVVIVVIVVYRLLVNRRGPPL